MKTLQDYRSIQEMSSICQNFPHLRRHSFQDNSYQYHQRTADSYLLEGNFQMAARHYQECLKNRFQDQQYLGWGSTQYRVGNYEGMTSQWYVKQICKNATIEHPINGLALALSELNDFAFCGLMVRQLLDNNPKSKALKCMKAHVYFNSGLMIEALELYNDCKDYEHCHVNKGFAEWKRNNREKAFQIFQQASEKYQQNPYAWLGLALTTQSNGNRIGYCNIASRCLEGYARPLYIIGQCHYNNQNYSQAFESFRSATTANPYFDPIYYASGRMLLAQLSCLSPYIGLRIHSRITANCQDQSHLHDMIDRVDECPVDRGDCEQAKKKFEQQLNKVCQQFKSNSTAGVISELQRIVKQFSICKNCEIWRQKYYKVCEQSTERISLVAKMEAQQMESQAIIALVENYRIQLSEKLHLPVWKADCKLSAIRSFQERFYQVLTQKNILVPHYLAQIQNLKKEVIYWQTKFEVLSVNLQNQAMTNGHKTINTNTVPEESLQNRDTHSVYSVAHSAEEKEGKENGSERVRVDLSDEENESPEFDMKMKEGNPEKADELEELEEKESELRRENQLIKSVSIEMRMEIQKLQNTVQFHRDRINLLTKKYKKVKNKYLETKRTLVQVQHQNRLGQAQLKQLGRQNLNLKADNEALKQYKERFHCLQESYYSEEEAKESILQRGQISAKNRLIVEEYEKDLIQKSKEIKMLMEQKGRIEQDYRILAEELRSAQHKLSAHIDSHQTEIDKLQQQYAQMQERRLSVIQENVNEQQSQIQRLVV